MGDIKRKKKLIRRPKKLYEKPRIEEENLLVQKYGLKNKKEVWKVETSVSKLRRRAKELIKGDDKEREEFFKKLNHMGFSVKETADVLALTKEDWLNRRLQTIVFKKNLATTPKQARQLITHKHVLVNSKAVGSPSFIVTKDLEDKIELNKMRKKE